MKQYGELTTLYWSLYYTGSGTAINRGVSQNIQKLHFLLPHAGDMRPAVVEHLSSFYELASRFSMDQFSSQESVGYIDQALALVSPEDKELYGRLLYKRGMALFEAGDLSNARVALEEAYALTPHLSIPLAGSIILQLGLVRSHQTGDGSDRSASLVLFERAGKMVRDPRCVEVEGIRLDEGRYLTAYGEGLINLGRYSDADGILELAQIKTSPNLAKRLLLIDVQEVRLYAAQKEHTIARTLVEEVREKARNLKSPRTLQRLDEITQAIPSGKKR